MRLTTKGQYAVRAMVNLASRGDGRPVALREISSQEGISLAYLEQLFLKLRKGDMVKSVRGPGGGYLLARDPSAISVGEVITVVEESLNPVACLDEDSAVCVRADTCITQKVWKGLGQRIKEFLNSISIKDLAGEMDLLKTTVPRDADSKNFKARRNLGPGLACVPEKGSG
ncbi:MAG TPA: Rrf2 family transcriptional regulator [Thermodesulfobacteriota bacterium]|nr:Rrf2 family transcriptional regulator [Thermodesulfobacteriota bacterium]